MNFMYPNNFYSFPQVPIANPQVQPTVQYQQPQQPQQRVSGFNPPLKVYQMKHVATVEQIQSDTIPVNGDPVFYSVGDTDILYKVVWQNGGIQMSKLRITPYIEDESQPNDEPEELTDEKIVAKFGAMEQILINMQNQINELTKRRDVDEPSVSKRKQSEKQTTTKQEQ